MTSWMVLLLSSKMKIEIYGSQISATVICRLYSLRTGEMSKQQIFIRKKAGGTRLTSYLRKRAGDNPPFNKFHSHVRNRSHQIYSI